MIVNIPVSIGELLDKISILKIKQKNITNDIKLNNINKELLYLENIVNRLNINKKSEFDNFLNHLYKINSELWGVEDLIRTLEHNKQFDHIFIQTARLVYILNDKRSRIKKDINLLYNSDIIEEKSYYENL